MYDGPKGLDKATAKQRLRNQTSWMTLAQQGVAWNMQTTQVHVQADAAAQLLYAPALRLLLKLPGQSSTAQGLVRTEQQA